MSWLRSSQPTARTDWVLGLTRPRRATEARARATGTAARQRGLEVEFEWCPSQISVLDLPWTRGADLGRFRQQFVSVNQAIAKLTVAPHQYIQPATGVAGLGTLALQCGYGHRVQLAIGDVALAPEPYRLGHES